MMGPEARGPAVVQTARGLWDRHDRGPALPTDCAGPSFCPRSARSCFRAPFRATIPPHAFRGTVMQCQCKGRAAAMQRPSRGRRRALFTIRKPAPSTMPRLARSWPTRRRGSALGACAVGK